MQNTEVSNPSLDVAPRRRKADADTATALRAVIEKVRLDPTPRSMEAVHLLYAAVALVEEKADDRAAISHAAAALQLTRDRTKGGRN